jgi:hypothetical protein
MPKEKMLVWYGDTPCGHEVIWDETINGWFCPTCCTLQSLLMKLEDDPETVCDHECDIKFVETIRKLMKEPSAKRADLRRYVGEKA